MVGWTSRGPALGMAAVLLLAGAMRTSSPAHAQTVQNWGIHERGWQICIWNRTDAALTYSENFLSNIAYAPDRIGPQTQYCGIRGQWDLFGGPANVLFSYDIRPPGRPNIDMWATITLNRFIGSNFGCDVGPSQTPESRNYTCSISPFNPNDNLVVTLVGTAAAAGVGGATLTSASAARCGPASRASAPGQPFLQQEATALQANIQALRTKGPRMTVNDTFQLESLTNQLTELQGVQANALFRGGAAFPLQAVNPALC